MSQLAEKIAAEVQKQGTIPLARFMELALYCPVYGYYEKEGDTVGRRGDFYTSVSVGSLFGELLAFQFAQWLTGGHSDQNYASEAQGGCKWIAEAGAHEGALARDILRHLRAWHPRLFNELQYWIIEPSERRQSGQRDMCSEFGTQVRWAKDLPSWAEMKSARPKAGLEENGIFFSNELLDAFPVHRFGWDATQRSWFEWGVTLDGGQFIWARLPEQQSSITLSHPAVASILAGSKAAAGDALPDGFIVDLSPSATEWWAQAARLLPSGRLITIDYGFEEHELFAPWRSRGTLRSYRSHRPGGNLIEDPGEQDITAHIDFSAIRKAGENAGLQTEALLTQAQFLTSIAANTWKPGAAFDDWSPERKRQFQTLTHPEHLGRAFRALIQSRQVPEVEFS